MSEETPQDAANRAKSLMPLMAQALAAAQEPQRGFEVGNGKPRRTQATKERNRERDRKVKAAAKKRKRK